MMYKLYVEGTGNLPEIVPGLMFTKEGAEEYCRVHRLTACYLMPVDDYRKYRNELGRVREHRDVRQVPMTVNDMYEYDAPPNEPWKPNDIKDVDWMPIDRRGIAKVPMAKPRWFKPSGSRQTKRK